jgi:hypothetical protein
LEVNIAMAMQKSKAARFKTAFVKTKRAVKTFAKYFLQPLKKGTFRQQKSFPEM